MYKLQYKQHYLQKPSETIKFYSHQLMQFFIQPCISPLSYIKIT